MSTPPRHLIEQLETSPSLPPGSEERFNGYGLMGLPFASGHILAMRRFISSSIGPGYTSVWHRAPNGDWTFYADVSPRQACTRFFGAIAADAIKTEIRITWTGPFQLNITMPAMQFTWEIEVGVTTATRIMNAAGHLLPAAAWQHRTVLTTMGGVAGLLLGVGNVGLSGRVPNGQNFVANPRVLWNVRDSRARLAGEEFGPPGPVQPQARLGDFWIPQRGILAIGQAYFEIFDPARHSSKVSCSETGDE